jgi:hypothetical protein
MTTFMTLSFSLLAIIIILLPWAIQADRQAHLRRHPYLEDNA